MNSRMKTLRLLALACALMCACALVPLVAHAQQDAPEPVYHTLDELEGKRFALVNGSVYDKVVHSKISGTKEDFYPSLSDCVTAVKGGQADAAVQLSYCCELAVNRSGGAVALLPETLGDVEEAFFFPHGDPLTEQFNEIIAKYEEDGTIEELTKKWVASDDAGKTLPEQDWPAPNGTLKFATSGVLEPFSYVGDGNEILGYDMDLALHICRELGYHLEAQTIGMDAIFASVESGKVDFGGTLTRTDERAEIVDFSRAVMPTTISIIVKAEGGSREADGGVLAGLSTRFRKTFIEEDRWQLILGGLGYTVLISVCAGVLGVLLGFGVVLTRRSGMTWLGRVVDVYQGLMGGIPIAVVLMVLYYVVFGSSGIPGWIVAVVAFALSFGSTSGTTMWTAVNGIDVGQEESGLALGYSRHEVFQKIVFPQAAQQFLPQLMGQFVALVKETSVVGFIAVQDLTRASDLIRSRTMDAFFPLIATACIYFVICRLLAWVLGMLAARVQTENRERVIEGVVDREGDA